jgi:hypothetical protein
LGSVSSLVSEKKIFEISANQSILLAMAAMLNIRLERKTNFVEDNPRYCSFFSCEKQKLKIKWRLNICKTIYIYGNY